MSQIYTIGFTKKSAEKFFSLIKSEKINSLIDVRLNNVSQLAGFAKKADLEYFLKQLCNVDYVHAPELAPTKDDLNKYKKGEMAWEKYEYKFMNLMAQRNIEHSFNRDILDSSCLLCSEHEPHLCHRRLVCDYLNEHTNMNLSVKHLL